MMNKNYKKSADYKLGTRLIILLLVIGFLFLSLAVYITFMSVAHKDDYMNHPANQRQWETEQNILRGTVTDRNGKILAHSERTDNGQIRIYNYGNLYTHIIGYSSRTYGKSQLEFYYNKHLTGMSELSALDIAGQFADEKTGNTIKLTIDHDLQVTAKKMMGNKNGAVVAINPQNGEILCMYSNPTFNPDSNFLEQNWDNLSSDETAPFLSRATSGLYAPGSIFKTVMLCAAFENGLEDFTVDDKGTIEIGDKVFENQKQKAYGEIDLKKAYAVSSNVAFMELGRALGADEIRTYAGKFGFGTDNCDIEIPSLKGNFNYKSKLPDGEIALMSIGQGETLVTPLQMANMVSTIANNGVNNKPHLVSKVTNQSGMPVETGKSLFSNRIISEETAKKVKEYMVETVKNGTAANASIYNGRVGGKTGTSENELENKEHTWFIGFAPAENPTIAIAVVCEYSGGTGSGNAVPVAREIIKTHINKGM